MRCRPFPGLLSEHDADYSYDHVIDQDGFGAVTHLEDQSLVGIGGPDLGSHRGRVLRKWPVLGPRGITVIAVLG